MFMSPRLNDCLVCIPIFHSVLFTVFYCCLDLGEEVQINVCGCVGVGVCVGAWVRDSCFMSFSTSVPSYHDGDCLLHQTLVFGL